jgi:hypothetical protein
MKRSFSTMNEGGETHYVSAKAARIDAEPSGASAPSTTALLELRGFHAAFIKYHGTALRLLDELTDKFRMYNYNELQRYVAALHTALGKRSDDPEGHAKIIRKGVEELRMLVRHLELDAIKARVDEIYNTFDNDAWEGFVKGGEVRGLSVVDKHLHLDIETASDETFENFSEYTKEKLREAKTAVKAHRLLDKVKAAVAYAPALARYRIMKIVNCKSQKRQHAELTAGQQYKRLEDVDMFDLALDIRLYSNVTACCKALEKQEVKEKQLTASRSDLHLREWKRRQNLETAANGGVYKCQRESGDDQEFYYSVSKKLIVTRPEGFKCWNEL